MLLAQSVGKCSACAAPTQHFAQARPVSHATPAAAAAKRAAVNAAGRRLAPVASHCSTLTEPSAAVAELEGCPFLEPDYALGPQIGRGSFAIVYEVTDQRSNERLVAKKLPKFQHNRLPAQQAAAVAAEASTQHALATASPQAVLRLADVRQDASYFYLISERCRCDLTAYLAGRPPLSEREAAHIVRQLLSALAAAHCAGVAYRDVKPANLLLRGVDANGLPEVCLADFGCSHSTLGPRPHNRSSPGTPLYSAPECVLGFGGMEADIWSAGILLYHLLSGAFPFCDPHAKISQSEYYRRVAEAPIGYTGPAWHRVSPAALDLCQRMLVRDCSRRISAEEALQHPWVQDWTSSRAAAAALHGGSSPAPAVGNHVVPAMPHSVPMRALQQAA